MQLATSSQSARALAIRNSLIRIISLSRRLFTDLLTQVLSHLGQNDYLAGMVAMSILAWGRDGAGILCSAVRDRFVEVFRRLWVTVRLDEKEAELLRVWLRERPEVSSSRQVAVYSRRGAGSGTRVYEFEPEVQTSLRLKVDAGDGSRRWMWVTQSEETNKRSATVSFLGHSKRTLEVLFEEARALEKRKREHFLTIVQVYDFGASIGLDWLHPQERVAKQPGRPVSSVILPNDLRTGLGQAEALLQDAKEFLAAEAWYYRRGIPYRRGYLLHGVPGGGKSSLVMAMAHDLQLPIYMLSLSSEKMTDDKLNSLLQFGMYDPPTILLLEDVDLLHSATLNRNGRWSTTKDDKSDDDKKDSQESDNETSKDKKKNNKDSGLTLSGLLNALDGPTATTGRLLFMTTNARERLDPALIRSGRIDYELEFKSAEQGQVQRLFEHFYSDDLPGPPDGSAQQSRSGESPTGKFKPMAVKALAQAYAERVAESGMKLTTADVQRYLVMYKTDPAKALEELPSLLKPQAKNSESTDGAAGDEGSSGGGGDPSQSSSNKAEADVDVAEKAGNTADTTKQKAAGKADAAAETTDSASSPAKKASSTEKSHNAAAKVGNGESAAAKAAKAAKEAAVKAVKEAESLLQSALSATKLAAAGLADTAEGTDAGAKDGAKLAADAAAGLADAAAAVAETAEATDASTKDDAVNNADAADKEPTSSAGRAGADMANDAAGSEAEARSRDNRPDSKIKSSADADDGAVGADDSEDAEKVAEDEAADDTIGAIGSAKCPEDEINFDGADQDLQCQQSPVFSEADAAAGNAEKLQFFSCDEHAESSPGLVSKSNDSSSTEALDVEEAIAEEATAEEATAEEATAEVLVV